MNQAKAQIIKEIYTDKPGHIEVPFVYINGFIVLDVVFQKLMPLKFIFDTGAENTILLKPEYAEALRVPYAKRIKIFGSDMSSEIYANICNDVHLQLTNLQVRKNNIIVLEKDYLYLEEYIGSDIDGILGADFFKGVTVKIDYRREVITLIDPAFFKKEHYKKYQELNIDVYNRKPYLTCTTEVNKDSPLQTRLLIDTGAGISALFHDNSDSLLALKGHLIKGNLGKGLGGDIEGYSGKIHSLKMGDLVFNNMISSFQSIDDILITKDKLVRNGLIGNLIWERFDVIIDYYNKKLFLKPTKNYNKEFEFDKSGITFFAFGPGLKKYYIKYVIENSPAAEAGIMPGDILVGIGNWSYKWYSLKKLNKMISAKSGKKIILKIKRDNQILKKEFVLRDLF